ncbi:MAG: hypothetical protein SFV15_02780 [Polyangiaceae bacterium]|nr:hypothetical protein [Polyangiaceae bacterium]
MTSTCNGVVFEIVAVRVVSGLLAAGCIAETLMLVSEVQVERKNLGFTQTLHLELQALRASRFDVDPVELFKP